MSKGLPLDHILTFFCTCLFSFEHVAGSDGLQLVSQTSETESHGMTLLGFSPAPPL
jgi:hypothetical protein